MFKASYQLPIVNGVEPFQAEMQAPVTVRAYVDDHLVTDGTNPMKLAEELVRANQGRIAQFMQAARQLALAGDIPGYARQLAMPGITVHYSRNYGMETLTLYVTPNQSGGETVEATEVDIRTIFIHWPIPGSMTLGEPPARWAFPNVDPASDGNGQKTFYSWYDPAYTPTTREPPTSAPPALADTGPKPTDSYNQHVYYEPSPSLNPADVGGYKQTLWLTDIGGTGFYDTLLSGKQYWEVEILRLPTETPTEQTFTKTGTDDGSSYDDPTVHSTPVLYKMKYPVELDTFLNPVVGVIPKHWYEKFETGQTKGTYTQQELKDAPQEPPRDTIKFTHRVIGLDPELNKPRSIGAVRSSTIKGDEVVTHVSTTPAGYYVDIPSPYWPMIYQSSTQTEVLAPTHHGGTPVHYAYNYIQAGWDAPMFTGFGSDTAVSFFLCGSNPWWDVDPSARPAVRGTQGISEWDFIAAGGYVYQCVRFGATDQGGASEATGSPSPVHGVWSIPLGGPPPDFVLPGALAKQYPGPGGPYFRCCGIVPSGTAPWIGPAYSFVLDGPHYDDPGSSFPTSGATTEIRSGSAIPSTTLRAEGGVSSTTTTTFHNQIFGDFLKQPDPVDGGGEGGGSRLPRKVMVPLDAAPGRTMPVIKGRGDNITTYRDASPADANYDPGGTNPGYDTGVDLGDIKVGDRIMIATDTKTGKIWFGINGTWKGPDGGSCDPHQDVGHACLMDRIVDEHTGRLKDAEYYAAGSYKYGPTWMRLHLGMNLKHKAPQGFSLLGLKRKALK